MPTLHTGHWGHQTAVTDPGDNGNNVARRCWVTTACPKGCAEAATAAQPLPTRAPPRAPNNSLPELHCLEKERTGLVLPARHKMQSQQPERITEKAEQAGERDLTEEEGSLLPRYSFCAFSQHLDTFKHRPVTQLSGQQPLHFKSILINLIPMNCVHCNGYP